MATVYAVGSWVLLQLYAVVSPALGMPEDSIGYLIVVFPAAVVFAWMFEISPEGLVPTKRVEQDESISHETGPEVEADRDTPGTNTQVSTSKAPVDTRPSIAVLPFVNMSSDEDNEYFADGLSEELHNVLAQVPGSRVAGRTSSFF